MTTPVVGNARNGFSYPSFMESVDGTKQYGFVIRQALNAAGLGFGVTIWRRVLPTVGHPADDRYTTYDLELNATAVAAGITPINPLDDHWALSMCVDSQDRIHLTGNSHSNQNFNGKNTQRYIYSGADDITTWTNPAYQFTTSGGVNSHVYNLFDRLANGTCLWFMSQDRVLGKTPGRQWIGAYLPPGAGTAWKKIGVGTNGGSAIARSEITEDGVQANRVYINGVFVAPVGWRGNTVEECHLWGIWRTGDEDATTQQQPFYFWHPDINAGLTSLTGWQTITGVPVSLPLTWATRTAASVGAVAPATSENVAAGIGIDRIGQPHFVCRNGDGSGSPAYVHLSYDKGLGRWKSLPLLTGPNATNPRDNSGGGVVCRMRNWIHHLGTFNAHVKVHNLDSTSDQFSFSLGGPCGQVARWYPEPIALKRGCISLQIPNGDTAAIYDFGNGYRAYAA